jgi:hypothetical protein
VSKLAGTGEALHEIEQFLPQEEMARASGGFTLPPARVCNVRGYPPFGPLWHIR